MSKIIRTVKLPADPQRVIEYISDVQNHPAFISPLKSVTGLSGGSHQIGTHWDWTFLMAGVEIQGRAETVAFEEGRHFSFRTTSGVESTFSYSAEQDGNGSKFTLQVEYKVPSAVLAKVLDSAIVERQNEAEGDRTAANLKAIFEG
ncbi:MAG: SRPBCC family protein [Acidobacteriia bacterium]|nr:SRPBCC family protein [Terriglobia bacterium]